jgi:hypothetical protein
MLDYVSEEIGGTATLFIMRGGQCRAQMTDLVIHIRGVRNGMSDFIAQEPSVTLTQIMQLLFHYCLCNA